MDGRGGCCIARYSGGGGYAGGVYDLSKLDRIMLKFRPIAPKPLTRSMDPSGGSSSENSEVTTRSGSRFKRKYAKDNSNNISTTKRCSRRRNINGSLKGPDKVITLPLLPETPAYPKDSPAATKPPVWLSFDNCAARPKAQYEVVWSTLSGSSFVTVECITETWVDKGELGCTDEERRMNLGNDTCPGFISDGFGRVTWINGAYKRMVGNEINGDEAVKVWLVMKEEVGLKVGTLPPNSAFTCRVRLQYTCEKERRSLIAPCDTWRMESGEFAWKLDVKVALSLGLGMGGES